MGVRIECHILLDVFGSLRTSRIIERYRVSSGIPGFHQVVDR